MPLLIDSRKTTGIVDHMMPRRMASHSNPKYGSTCPVVVQQKALRRTVAGRNRKKISRYELSMLQLSLNVIISKSRSNEADATISARQLANQRGATRVHYSQATNEQSAAM